MQSKQVHDQCIRELSPGIASTQGDLGFLPCFMPIWIPPGAHTVTDPNAPHRGKPSGASESCGWQNHVSPVRGQVKLVSASAAIFTEIVCMAIGILLD